MNHILGLATRISWLPVSIAAGEFIALVVLWLSIWKRRSRTPTAVQFVLIVASVRFVLFATPLSWLVYYATIDPAFIDSRERDIVANNIKSFVVPPRVQKFLAVGSSQTRYVYSPFSKKNPILGYYVLAGMQPDDYVEQFGQVSKEHPQAILLYISEFDLARPVDLTTSRLSDLPIQRWPLFYQLVARAAGTKAAWDTMVSVAIADLFPENKYSFIFADYAKQLRVRLALSPATVPDLQEQTRVEKNSLLKLSARNVSSELIFLDAFLDLCKDHGIPVVVVEGQYNPIAYTDANIAMNRDVIAPALANLEKKFSNVAVIRRSAVHRFTEDEYQDAYHVKPAAGEQFTGALLTLLDRQQTLRLLKRGS